MLFAHNGGQASLTVCSHPMDCTSFIGQRWSVGAQYCVIFGSADLLTATATHRVETVGLPDRSSSCRRRLLSKQAAAGDLGRAQRLISAGTLFFYCTALGASALRDEEISQQANAAENASRDVRSGALPFSTIGCCTQA